MEIVISVVVPVYNEEAVLSAFYARIKPVMEGLGEPYEIVFVNDGSKDGTLSILKSLHKSDGTVKYINFSRNFGHQLAVTAGLDYASGQAIIVIDSDLQDPPEFLPELIRKWREGYDVVHAVREKRAGESLIKKFTAWGFYRLLRAVTNTEVQVDAGDFRLMSRRAVQSLQSMRERDRFIRGMASWIGFSQTTATFVRESRFAGETKYPFSKMVKFAFAGITSFSVVPLRASMYMGMLVSLGAFIYIAYALVLKYFTDQALPGWTSTVIAISLMGGVQLVTIGVLGEYVGRIYDEVKARPLYLVEDAVGFKKQD